MGDEVVVVNVPQPRRIPIGWRRPSGFWRLRRLRRRFCGSLRAGWVNWNAPTFWIGLVIAMLRGVMGFYTNKAAGGTTTIQTGQHATTNVMEGRHHDSRIDRHP